MKIQTLIVLQFLFINTSYAICETSSIPTMLDSKNNGIIGCESAIISLKSDPTSDREYQKSVNEKLANLLEVKLRQSLFDLGTSSDFYERENQSFLISNDVKNSCKFDFVSNLETKGCNGQALSDDEKERIAILSKAIGKSSGNSSKSLMEGLVHLYGSNKYGANFDKKDSLNQCPLEGNIAPLNSQITNTLAKNIIEKFSGDGHTLAREEHYTKFPQLFMIKEAEKYSPGIKEKFEKYIKAFDKNKDDPKKYLTKFFFEKENKEILGKGVSRRCLDVREGISSFICHPLTNFSSNDPKISKKLFNNYNPKKEYQDQKNEVRADQHSFKTYAYLCQNQNKEEVGQVDRYYRLFSDGIRPENSIETDGPLIKQFCERYGCQSPEVKEAVSCKNGGPLSSKDLAFLDLKDDFVASQISYLEGLEWHKKNKMELLSRMSDRSTSEDERPVLSEFDMNIFGPEETSKLFGVGKSPESVAFISVEMKARNITPTNDEEFKQIVENGNLSSPKHSFAKNELVDHFVPPVTPVNQTQVSTQAQYDNFTVPTTIKKDTSIQTKNVASEFVSNSSAEKDQMLKDLKKLMEEKEKERNLGHSNVTHAEKPTDRQVSPKSSTAYSNFEQAQLEAWASNLRAKDHELRARENELNIKDAEYWQKIEELKTRERAPASVASVAGNSAKASSQALRQQEKLKLESEATFTPRGITVSPEHLLKIDKDTLKEKKVDIEEPFIISIRLKSKLIHVRVAKMNKGKHSYLVPYLNDDNKEVHEAILKSPIFKEFNYYLTHKESDYSPVNSKDISHFR